MEGFPGEKKRKYPKLSKEDIQKARKTGDFALLSAAGKKGAEKSNEVQRKNKENIETANEYWQEKSQEKTEKEAQAQLEAGNEHILPIESDEEEAA